MLGKIGVRNNLPFATLKNTAKYLGNVNELTANFSFEKNPVLIFASARAGYHLKKIGKIHLCFFISRR
jgi:hypothetical protein